MTFSISFFLVVCFCWVHVLALVIILFFSLALVEFPLPSQLWIYLFVSTTLNWQTVAVVTLNHLAVPENKVWELAIIFSQPIYTTLFDSVLIKFTRHMIMWACLWNWVCLPVRSWLKYSNYYNQFVIVCVSTGFYLVVPLAVTCCIFVGVFLGFFPFHWQSMILLAFNEPALNRPPH